MTKRDEYILCLDIVEQVLAHRHKTTPLKLQASKGYQFAHILGNFKQYYFATDTGDIFSSSLSRCIKLKPGVNLAGYKSVKLTFKDKTSTTQFVHRLVWSAFNTPIPDGYVINHLNGDKGDNRLANLECVTRSENTHHAIRKGLISFENKGSTYMMINPAGEFVQIKNMRQFCRDNDLTAPAMHNVLSGKAKHHKGWRAVDMSLFS